MLALALFVLPLSAQSWDLRLEAPFPQGQDVPQTRIQSTGQEVSGSLSTGTGAIVTASHRIVRVGPVLKLEWNAEFVHLRAAGQIQQGTVNSGSRLRQDGVGAGVNAQFWVPFTGFAGEVGVLERLQSYRFEGAGYSQERYLARPWMRLGARWALPLPELKPFLSASYQEAITNDHPVQEASVPNLGTHLSAQGSGQEFQRLWTLGVGIAF